jgi:hypothetical protein
MVLKLRELLIKNVAIHLSSLPNESCKRLTAKQRERILHWLISHDRLSHDIVPYITKNLLSVPLKSLIIHQCNQVQGRF